MRRLLRQEDGIALLMALGFTIVLTILVTSMIAYTSSGSPLPPNAAVTINPPVLTSG